jgi:hypothetical protein
MAESDLAKTSYRGVARAEINIVTPPDLDAAMRTIKDDLHTYEPLIGPGHFAPGFAPPEPPAPTEQQLRERLVAALDAEHQADDRLALAQSAHVRALRHVEQCQAALDAFANLDDEIAASTIAQLVDADRSRIELAVDLHDRIAEREMGRVALQAARTADETLSRDLTEARGKAAEAGRRADALIAAVLSFKAQAVAERHAALLEQAAAVAETLHAFNQFAANRLYTMPQTVRAVLGNDTATLARRRDHSSWREAAARLRADPLAVIEVP